MTLEGSNRDDRVFSMRQVGSEGTVNLDRYPAGLLIGFLIFWTWLAIRPFSRPDWLLENVLVLAAIPVLACFWTRGSVSWLAWRGVFLFLMFHTIGAHYTYSRVPYDLWWQSFFGYSLDHHLGFNRNQYDRWVHFLYGLLLLPLITDLMKKYFLLISFLSRLIPMMIILSHAALYELFEWLAAITFSRELGEAYLGAQGGIWDAQKDMVLALLGALLASTASFIIRLVKRGCYISQF